MVPSGNQKDGPFGIDTPKRHADRRHTAGRRRGDHLPVTTFTKTWVVVAVSVINALALVGEAMIGGQNVCP
jgi:hypothetical protein